MGIPLTQQASNESRLSMSESVSEFFDAQEVLLSASSSENEVQRGGWRSGVDVVMDVDLVRLNYTSAVTPVKSISVMPVCVETDLVSN